MKAVVIGLGSMGKRRIRLMKGLNKEITVYGIDCSESRRTETEEQFQIKSFTSLETLLEQERVDCAFICTSPDSHAGIIKQCLEEEIHVFTEINLVADLYEENIALAKKKSVCLFLSSTQMYRKEMQMIKEAVGKQRANYLYHVGQYLPDWHPWESYQEYFVGKKRTNGCRELLAIELPWILNTFGNVKNYSVMADKTTNLQIDYPDYYSIQLLHENGSIGTIVIDVVSREPVRKLEIMNETLYMQWSGKPDTLYQKNLKTGNLDSICKEEYLQQKGYQAFINEYAYLREIEEFFQSIQGKKSEYGFEEDLETLKLIDRLEAMAGDWK